MPEESFIFDEVDVNQLETALDKSLYFNDMSHGVTYERFMQSKALKIFVPVATYDKKGAMNRLTEAVSVVEGTVLPFFGFAYRLDKVQFSFQENDGVDHSAHSIEHAQHVANLIVDEARLSGNRYGLVNDENARLLTNFDIHTVDVIPDNPCSEGQSVTTELYLF